MWSLWVDSFEASFWLQLAAPLKPASALKQVRLKEWNETKYEVKAEQVLTKASARDTNI